MKQHVTIEDVTLAYYECRRTKRRTASQIEYELDYEMNNLQLWRELNDGTHRIGQSIGFCITYPKLREVFAAKSVTASSIILSCVSSCLSSTLR